LPRPARAYLAGVWAAAALGLLLSALAGPDQRLDGQLFVVLLLACSAASLFETLAPGHYSLQPNYAFLVWGAVLLPAPAVGPLALACFLPALVTRDVPLFKTSFNIENYILTGLLVHLIAARTGLPASAPGDGGAAALALLAAGVGGAMLNHGLIVIAVALAGEQRLRATLPQLIEGMPVSMGVGLTGGCLAVLWSVSPWLLLVAAGPLALVYRALWVPMLQHQATTDAKTGLLNHERFMEEFESLLESSRSRGSELAVAMIDLDHLRQINSRCGHLAGDRAIVAVADLLAAVTARRGIAARFGGEEFCLLLPGLSAIAAAELLAQVQADLREVEFRESADEPELRITFSAGVAVHPEHGNTTADLLERADVACYDAKAAGRDRVRMALSGAAASALQELVGPSAAPPPQLSAPASLPLPDRAPAPVSATTRLRGLVPPALRGRRLGSGSRPSADIESENLRLRGLLKDHQHLIARMQQASLSALEGLARAAERRDGYTAGHGDRVAVIARGIGVELGMGPDEVEALTLGAGLHDLGKLAVPEAVLGKGGALDDADRAEIEHHAELASRLVADLELPGEVKQIIRSGHERYDGTGYPDGLAGEDIPLAARIIAVAEALDAMTSDRPYREAMDATTAHAEIVAGAGLQFCPEVVGSLGRWLRSQPPFVVDVSKAAKGSAKSADRGDRAPASAGTRRGPHG
jgi:diguanylate cyclase (GGDEF)-like protein